MSEQDLKVVTGDTEMPEEPLVPATKPVSTFRLVATLAVAGALAGLLIVLVNLHTMRSYPACSDLLFIAVILILASSIVCVA